MKKSEDRFCRICGRRIEKERGHYIVRVEVFSADEPPEKRVFLEEGKDFRAEVEKLLETIANTDPQELEEQVYKFFKFDLCRPCQREFIKNPFGWGR